MRAAALTAIAIVSGCGGSGAHAPAEIVNRAPVAAPPAPGGCPPGGETLRADLDGDKQPDAIRLTPEAAAVTCLEITTGRDHARSLVCGGDATDPIEQAEDGLIEDGRPAAPCDPSGTHVELAGRDPSGVRTFRGVLVAAHAPTGTALWLDGGDAAAMIVWDGGGWRWIIVGA